ncbi:MAG: polyprenyl synthetase family protein [Acidobacteriota bacterium]
MVQAGPGALPGACGSGFNVAGGEPKADAHVILGPESGMTTASKPSLTQVQAFRLIEPELKDVEVRLKTEAISSLRLVDELNQYLHEAGGKRLRPGLLLLASKLSGAPRESAVRLGVVVELIHVATLVHDDIIDNSNIRRGRASINAKWGNEVTVLFGDWLYMTAFWVALKEQNFRILDILIDITRKMVEGELLQLERNHRLDTTSDEYLRICWHKTAHLFSGCGRLAAILGRLEPASEESLAEFGEALGMAFQLTDDLLDFTSDPSVLGKPVLKDLEEGNVTLPIISLMQRVEPEERNMLAGIVRERDFSADNKSRILELVGRYETLEDLRSLARRYAEQARRALDTLPDSVYRDALLALPDLVLNRDR